MIAGFDPDDVRRVERRAVQAVADAGHEGVLMRRAARAVAAAARSRLKPGRPVTALVGGGDNGGDALFAVAELAADGFPAKALLFSDHPHAEGLAAARSAGVEVLPWKALFPTPDPAKLLASTETDTARSGSADSVGSAGPARMHRDFAAAGSDSASRLGVGEPGGFSYSPETSHNSAIGGSGSASVQERSEPSSLSRTDYSLDFPHPGSGDGSVADVWIDGIVGAGLTSPLRQPLAGIIEQLNRIARDSGVQVIAVDVPSGLYRADGGLDGPVLKAAHTVTMIAAKSGLLLPPAAWQAGSVEVADLDAGVTLPEPVAVTVDPASIAESLVIPGAFDHKYTRGVVGIVAGSTTYPGAGLLAVEGAVSAGPGMVRLDSDPAVGQLVLARHPGVVLAPGRVQSVLVGSGLDDALAPRAKDHAKRALEQGTPLVLDAGALELIRDLPALNPAVVLTPHAGEAAALLSDLTGELVSRTDVDAHPLDSARMLVEQTGATVVLKGGRTLIAGGQGPVVVVNQAPGWAGVAGSGDVLAGIIASILAQRQAKAENSGQSALTPAQVLEATAAAVWLHDQASAIASGTAGSLVRATNGSDTISSGGSAHPGHPIEPQAIAAAVPGLIGSLLDFSIKRSEVSA